MFLKVHSYPSGKESFFNFDKVMSITQEKNCTVLYVDANGKNIQTRYEVTENAEDLVGRLIYAIYGLSKGV